jgi:hypothetical protein
VDTVFILHLALSFVVGGAFVAGCTGAAERLGPNIGGLIGGFPSTIVVGLLFIGITSGPDVAAASTRLIPIMVAANGLFLIIFAVSLRWSLMHALTISLTSWFVVAALLLKYFPGSFGLSVTLFIFLALLMIVVVERFIAAGDRVRRERRAAYSRLLVRGIAGGGVVGSAVLGSKIAGPALGGILAVFPAVFGTSLTMFAREYGVTFVRSLVRPLLVSGTINIVVYACVARALFPVAGIWVGTGGAFACSAISAMGTLRLIRWLADRKENV